MSIFSRIFKIGQAAANKAIESLEKPELMLDQAIADKEKELREMKQAIQQVIATERQSKAQLEKEKSEKFNWEQKAEAAMRAGREDLAVKALERAAEHEARATALEPSWQSQQTAASELKVEVTKVEAQIAEYRRNKDFIIAQSKAAQVKKDIYEAKARISSKRTADDLLARMKAKAERQGFEAEAAKEMADVAAPSLEDEFKGLTTSASNPGVQEKLDQLRQKLQGNATA